MVNVGHPACPEIGIEASKLDLARFGPEWVFGRWLKGEEEWCRAAFAFAGGTGGKEIVF